MGCLLGLTKDFADEDEVMEIQKGWGLGEEDVEEGRPALGSRVSRLASRVDLLQNPKQRSDRFLKETLGQNELLVGKTKKRSTTVQDFPLPGPPSKRRPISPPLSNPWSDSLGIQCSAPDTPNYLNSSHILLPEIPTTEIDPPQPPPASTRSVSNSLAQLPSKPKQDTIKGDIIRRYLQDQMKGEPYAVTREFLMTLLIRVLDEDYEEINRLNKDLRKGKEAEVALMKQVGELNKTIKELEGTRKGISVGKNAGNQKTQFVQPRTSFV